MNPFAEIRAHIDEAERRVAARLDALEKENAYLKAENARLWSDEYARQDADVTRRTP